MLDCLSQGIPDHLKLGRLFFEGLIPDIGEVGYFQDKPIPGLLFEITQVAEDKFVKQIGEDQPLFAAVHLAGTL